MKQCSKYKLSPIMKWVGGKRQLLGDILPRIDIEDDSLYVEPFVGGAAVLLGLQPKHAIINDYNAELVNVYKCIKNHPHKLLELLEVHERLNTAEYFYEVRALDRTKEFVKFSNLEKAARIIYLNKTCYNGLYRVNSAGQFNTPYGRYKNPNIVNEQSILALSAYFKDNDITIMQGDYRKTLKRLNNNDNAFVYMDPPYMPISSSSAFTGYTENGFSYEQQKILKNECDILNSKGIRFLQSNSYCDEILELYKDYHIEIVHAKRSINAIGTGRGEINEVLISN